MSSKKGTVYGVKNLDTDKIEMVGSTMRPLRKRALEYPRQHEWFRNGNYELVPLRTVEHEDELFFPYFLRAVENMEIARHHTWYDEGGRNLFPPLMQFTSIIEIQSEIARAGGRVGGRTNAKSGHMAAVGRKQTQVPGHQQRANRGAIQKAIESGQIASLGREQGRKNVESGHLASLRTPEHQRLASKAVPLEVRRRNGRKNVESGQFGAIAHLGRSIGGQTQNHLRWHVKRNIIKPGCKFCEAQMPVAA
jgi:hypothetical protein